MCSNPSCNGNRRDKVVLRTTYIKDVKFKIIKIRTGCQYIAYFYYSENLNRAAQNLQLGHMRPVGRGLGIAGPMQDASLLFNILTLVFHSF